MNSDSWSELLAPCCGAPLHFAAQDVVFRQGDAATALYLVESGRVRLERHLPHGAPLTLHEAGADELLAEGALFADAYHCDAVASEALVLRRIDKAQLLARMAQSSELSLVMLLRVTRQLHRARALLELRNIHSARERTMQYLRMMLPADGGAMTVSRPLNALAAELGLSPEAFYRALADLHREGRIVRDGRTMRLRV